MQRLWKLRKDGGDKMDWPDGKPRCRWANPNNPRYLQYHDQEWGVPVHDDQKLFEMLILESFQAGLSWECVLNKWDAFRRAFDDFDSKIVMRKHLICCAGFRCTA